MGVLDIPAPVFAWIDGVLADALAPLPRLAVWALLLSALSMALYAWLSPQAALRRLKGEIREVRRELRAHDGDFAGVAALARRNIRLSLKHVRLVAPAALLACIPVIMLIVWLDRAYSFAPTESGLPLDIKVRGGTARIEIVEGAPPAGPHRLVVRDGGGRGIISTRLEPDVTLLEKRRLRHWLAGNAAGYLPQGAPVETVRIGWPRRQILEFGPAWMRGWETPFFTLALVFSLAVQAAFRIE